MKSLTHPVQICTHTEIVSWKLLFFKTRVTFQCDFHFDSFPKRFIHKTVYSFISTPIHIKRTPNDLISCFKLEKRSIIIIISIDISTTSNARKRKKHSNVCVPSKWNKKKMKQSNITTSLIYVYVYSLYIHNYVTFFYAVVVLRKLFQRYKKCLKPFLSTPQVGCMSNELYLGKEKLEARESDSKLIGLSFCLSIEIEFGEKKVYAGRLMGW